MSERLTRQELSWLLTQEARGAAERLRKGVQILTSTPAEPEPSERGAGSDRPVTLTTAGEETEGLESSLDQLEGAMQKLSELSGPVAGRGRRGRVDLAALLWEVAPDAKVQLAPGAGTEVFAEENELRRMLHVFLGGWNQSGVGGAQLVTVRREGDEVRIGVQLGPDTAPISAAERGWLARGHRFDGVSSGSASSTFYGIGIYHVSGDVDSVAFASDASFGMREVSVSDGTNTYTMSGLALFNIGLGAEIRVATLFSITPMLRLSLGSMDSTEGTVTFSPERQGDGKTEPDFKNGETIGIGRMYAAITLGASVHFDIFGK